MVAMLGGAVGLAYRFWEMRRADETKRLDKERERRAVQRAALQEFYRSAFTLHHDYKKIRRTLRSLSFCEGQDRKIERLAFEKLMEALEDCQLQAESLHRSVEAQADLFGNEQKNLSSYLSLVDRYLRNLVRQYEEGYQERRQLDPKDLMSLNAEVRSFIDRSEKGDPIWTDLFLPADKVRDSLLELIAKTTPDITV
ncbi:hypothetical protein [Phyllobacterium zundukense]|uniref:Uncharacterized protein n=1 Tax=Phyllobacterium zundukense TaxID=1867719 RepID=A0ACD4CWC1_9HYPH|nr:hypothetical protein [Phyllobacterium zundukense]UXN57895.1 hypothetical protein N8E88_06290 [Phyllobacterium zundukense]